jgi:hypothetical protein
VAAKRATYDLPPQPLCCSDAMYKEFTLEGGRARGRVDLNERDVSLPFHGRVPADAMPTAKSTRGTLAGEPAMGDTEKSDMLRAIDLSPEYRRAYMETFFWRDPIAAARMLIGIKEESVREKRRIDDRAQANARSVRARLNIAEINRGMPNFAFAIPVDSQGRIYARV